MTISFSISSAYFLGTYYMSPMWSRNLNRENGGKRRTWVQKRKEERKRITYKFFWWDEYL
jgi:hypothetical protein